MPRVSRLCLACLVLCGLVAVAWRVSLFRGVVYNSQPRADGDGPTVQIGLGRGYIYGTYHPTRFFGIHRSWTFGPIDGPVRWWFSASLPDRHGFYALRVPLWSVAFLLLILPGVTLSLPVVRRLRGRCLACGYPRAGLAPDATCPECGTPAKA